MKLYVIKPIRLKRAGKLFDVSPGAIVEISKPEKAQALIDSGHVRPLLPPDVVGEIQAVRIYSKILQDEVWVLTSPDAMAFISIGAIVYHPEEIQNLRGATEDEIRAVHRVKKELGGRLIQAKDRGRA